MPCYTLKYTDVEIWRGFTQFIFSVRIFIDPTKDNMNSPKGRIASAERRKVLSFRSAGDHTNCKTKRNFADTKRQTMAHFFRTRKINSSKLKYKTLEGNFLDYWKDGLLPSLYCSCSIRRNSLSNVQEFSGIWTCKNVHQTHSIQQERNTSQPPKWVHILVQNNLESHYKITFFVLDRQ